MANQAQVYEITFSSPEFKTLEEYLKDPSSPAFLYQDNVNKFLAVQNKNGVTNKDAIFSRYMSGEKKANESKDPKNYTLKVGTKLAVEMQQVNRAGLLTQGIEIVSNDIPAFKAKALADLEEKEGYAPVDTLKPIKGKIQSGSAKDIYPDMTVWIWCRSLSRQSDFTYQGEIFNITPFIEKCDTNVGKNGGNFEMTLPPLICEYKQGKWVIKKENLQFYKTNRSTAQQGEGFIAEGNLYSLDDEKELRRNTFLFNNIIDSNDVVFIRYETLKIEKEDRKYDRSQLNIDKKQLPGKIYDMIGLVDINALAVNPSSNEVSINISGRDLTKLLIEDGTYFYALEMAQGKLNFAGGSTSQNELIQRVISDNALQYMHLYYNNSIENVFKFVIQQLSTIKVVPNELFEAYGDRRNKRFNQEKKQVTEGKPIADELTRLEKEAKSAIKSLRSANQLTLSTQQEEDQKVQEIFAQKKRFLQEIRTRKVRKVDENLTAGWKSFSYLNERGISENIIEDTFPDYFVDVLYALRETRVVSNPEEAAPIVIAIDQIIDIETAKPEYKTQFREDFASGIWQIIKLVIDKGVTERRIVDSSLSSANGSLLNFFRKVCQEPFVEFYTDTYGDMFHFIARKPPYDRAGLLSLLKGQEITEEGGRTRTISAVINIEPEDVLNEQLAYDDIEVASWYHLAPQANLIGFGDAYSLAYLPAIYFPEYAEIWGSKPMQVVHNYLPNIPINPQDSDLDLVEKQAIEDTKYMIESNAYLPFTRKGTLMLNGDRRLKVGNIIRYKPTGEIFFIDAVQQKWSISTESIDRVTVVQVSRGMVEQLIYGIPARNTSAQSDDITNYISYFNIINTTPKFSYKDGEQVETTRVKIGERLVQQPTGINQTNQAPVNIGLSPFRDDIIVERGNINIDKLKKFPSYQRSVFTRFINAINARGYYVNITDGVRTYQQQYALWLQNDMNAKPGHSKHETGNAIDINLIDKVTGKTYLKETSKAEWLATGVIDIASALRLKWASGDGSFYGKRGVYVDRVHFEIVGSGRGTGAITEPIYEERDRVIKRKVLNRDEIFSNFKVNKNVFNFFVRNEHAAKEFIKVTTTAVYTDAGPSLNEVVIRNQR